MVKVLIGSPVHQKAPILKEFLSSIKYVSGDQIEYHYLFIDDNDSHESSELLQQFSVNNENVTVYRSGQNDAYIRDHVTHRWNERLIWKVASFKNLIIRIALEFNFDYLFLIDSDLVIHPKTIEHLISTEKDIISEIFWTKWKPDSTLLPQVWLRDHYTQFQKERSEALTQEEQQIRHKQFIDMLKLPGVYEVGGLGACTLISRSALLRGVSFDEIKNISFWGEDRHFCIRASALGIGLYVDTHYPAYHIYRETDLTGVKKYKELHYEEINKRVLSTVSEGIGALGTFHYVLGYQVDWEPYFVEELRISLFEQIQHQAQDYARDHTKVNAYVENLKYISYNLELGIHRVEFSLHNYILQKGQRSESHYNCTCYVNDECKITSFSVESTYDQEACFQNHNRPEKLTLSMIIRNEGNRFLRQVLEKHALYIDSAVIIDDGSTDDSVRICEETLKNIHYIIISNSTFAANTCH